MYWKGEEREKGRRETTKVTARICKIILLRKTQGTKMNRNKIEAKIDSMKSDHQHRVESFMEMMGITAQPSPSQENVSDDKRLLLARLVMEEVLEYLNGLGVSVSLLIHDEDEYFENVEFEDLDFEVEPGFNLKEIVDGVCDVRFVTTKALSVFGVPDEPFQAMVDTNNLLKFAEGGYRDENGKWVKPKDHPAPSIDKLLDSLSCVSLGGTNNGINPSDDDKLENNSDGDNSVRDSVVDSDSRNS